MKKGLLLIAVILLMLSVKAQDYRYSVGLRAGESSGFNIRVFLDDKNLMEGLASFRDGGSQLTILKEFYLPVFLRRSDHCFFYYGYGAHAGFAKHDNNEHYSIGGKDFYYYTPLYMPLIGVDGFSGLEYRLHRIPFSFGVEAKPFLEFFGKRPVSVNFFDISLTARYNF
jgi:hypothetical protein